MTDLVAADLHLNDNPRDEYRFGLFPVLHSIIKEHHVKRVLILGDITEEKDRHSARLTNRIVNAIDKLAEQCDVLISRGNHDYTEQKVPFFRFLSRIPGVTWVNKPTVIGGDLFLPHTSNYKDEWWEAQTTKVFDAARYIFAHNTFEGAQSEHGVFLHGIPTTVFPKKARVISGDIHTPQVIDQVTYVGAPYRIDFGDDYEPRVLLLHDEGGIVSLPIDMPQKRLITIKQPNDLKKSHEVFPGDIVKVRVHLKTYDPDQWWECKRLIREWGAAQKIKVHAIAPVVEKAERTMKQRQQHKRKDDGELILQYVKARNIDDGTLQAAVRLMEG